MSTRNEFGMPNGTILRAADESELFWHVLYENGNLMIQNSISVLTSFPLNLDHFRRSCLVLLKRYQILRCCLARSPYDNRLQWIESFKKNELTYEWILSSSLLALSEEEHWLEVLHKEQREPFDTDLRLLWRLRVIPSTLVPGEQASFTSSEKKYRTIIVACFHHALVDGMTRQTFWNDLCCTLISIVSGELYLSKVHQKRNQDLNLNENVWEQVAEFKNLPECILPPPFSKILGTTKKHKLIYLWSLFGSKHFNIVSFFRSLATFRTNPLSILSPCEKFDANNPRHATSIIPIFLSAVATDNLTKKCRQLGTTINGIVTAVAGLAMQEIIQRKTNNVMKSSELKSTLNNVLQSKKYFEENFSALLCSAQVKGCGFHSALPIHFFHTQNKGSAVQNETMAINCNKDSSSIFRLKADTSQNFCSFISLLLSLFSEWRKKLSRSNNESGNITRCSSECADSDSKIGTQSKGPSFFQKLKRITVRLLLKIFPPYLETWQAINGRRWLETPSKNCYQQTAFEDYLKKYFENICASPNKENFGDNLYKQFILKDQRAGARNKWNSNATFGTIKRTQRSISQPCTDDFFKSEKTRFGGDSYVAFQMNVLPGHSNTCNNVIDNDDLKGANQKQSAPAPKNDQQFKSLPTCCPGLGSCAVLMIARLSVGYGHFTETYLRKLTAKIRRQINDLVQLPGSYKACWDWNVAIGFTSLVKKEQFLFQAIAPTPRTSAFLISNAGIWDQHTIVDTLNKRDNEWVHKTDSSFAKSNDVTKEAIIAATSFSIAIENSWSCVTQHVIGMNTFAHNIVTVNSRLCWSFQYHTNCIAPSLAMQYALLVAEKLENLSTPSYPTIENNSNESETNDTTRQSK
ncbi:hypothetical protein IE077_000042 [Cardiosporidium cionae]|uniref:Condensation domain-containing protein n=1 Tax=Cardiosporidium cionae TaxID=476202 RepID=A0ABQ7J6B3_9APIC|nr:hypothetical protein IE077_000042 [Cardiosporidium cionae]|eukprot:KAF8819516.1 hypothetical protein IE077_000042 [Cardiosporidium cionae]